MIWNHKMWYVMIRYDKIWYVMLTYGPKNLKIMCFQNWLAMLGICLGIITGHFEAIKKMEKLKILLFSEVVYWPLGYDLLSSLSNFSPEINIFEKSNKYFSKLCFRIFIFYFMVFVRINNPKNWPNIALKRINILYKPK